MSSLRLTLFCLCLATSALGADAFECGRAVALLRQYGTGNRPHFGAVEVRLARDSVDVLPLGGERFVLLRPDLTPTTAGERCFTGVPLTIVDDLHVSLAEALAEVRVCARSSRPLPSSNLSTEPRIRSGAFPALQRYAVWQSGGLGTSGALFDSNTHAAVTKFSATRNYERVVPWGPAHVLAFSDRSQPLAFEVLPADGGATLEPFTALENWNEMRGDAWLYPRVLLSSPRQLAVANVETQQLMVFERSLFPAPGARPDASETGPFGEVFQTPGGLWFVHRRDTALTVHQLDFQPGKAPVRLFSETGPLAGRYRVEARPEGTRLILHSWPSEDWLRLAQLFDLDDARLDELIKRDMPPSSDELPSASGANSLSEVTEQLFTWPNPAPQVGCYLVVSDDDELARTALHDRAGTASCAWSPKVWDTVRTTTQRPQVKTPAEVADFCARALLRQRGSELRRCVEDKELLQFLGPWTTLVRQELALWVSQAGGLPQPTLKAQGDALIATWSFTGDKRPRSLRMTLVPTKQHGGQQFPRAISRLEFDSALGKTLHVP